MLISFAKLLILHSNGAIMPLKMSKQVYHD